MAWVEFLLVAVLIGTAALLYTARSQRLFDKWAQAAAVKKAEREEGKLHTQQEKAASAEAAAAAAAKAASKTSATSAGAGAGAAGRDAPAAASGGVRGDDNPFLSAGEPGPNNV
jgi:hypothetical protein